MKSNIEKVYSKLPSKKHNFKNHKVELANLQVIISQFREINSSAMDAGGFILKAKDTLIKSLENMQSLKDEMNDAQQMAKDLGVEIPELNDYEERINTSISDYEKNIDALNSI